MAQDKRSAHGGRLIVVCGLPGAGKTTHAKQLEIELGAIRLCPDEWMRALSLDVWDERMRARIEALEWQLGQQLLMRGLTVVIEWGTWGRGERDTLRLGARKLGAAVELHYLTAPVEVLFDRLQQRGSEDPPIKLADLKDWAGAFEIPTAEEIALFDTLCHAPPEA